jgi:hypothetical protein
MDAGYSHLLRFASPQCTLLSVMGLSVLSTHYKVLPYRAYQPVMNLGIAWGLPEKMDRGRGVR